MRWFEVWRVVVCWHLMWRSAVFKCSARPPTLVRVVPSLGASHMRRLVGGIMHSVTQNDVDGSGRLVRLAGSAPPLLLSAVCWSRFRPHLGCVTLQKLKQRERMRLMTPSSPASPHPAAEMAVSRHFHWRWYPWRWPYCRVGRFLCGQTLQTHNDLGGAKRQILCGAVSM